MAFRWLVASTVCLSLWTPRDSCAQNTKRALEGREQSQARRAARCLSLLAANGGGKLLRDDIASLASAELRPWVEQNQAAILGAGPNPFATPARWGIATTNGSKLFLHITAWPQQGKLVVPRLHNSVEIAKFTHQADTLKLSPNQNDWEITLPEKPIRDTLLPVVELQLDRPLQHGQNSPPVVHPGDDGVLRMHARYAVTHGQMLRFEPQSYKNTVGYWVQEEDWVEWSFEPQDATNYDIVLRYGCGNGEGGSEIEILVGESSYPFVVEATGGFQAWREVTIGSVEGLKGTTPLKVTPKKKAKNAVMDIQEIRLQPK